MTVRTLVHVSDLRNRLEEIDNAISAASSGSSYSIGNRTLTRQDLTQLHAERTRVARDLKRTEAALEGVRNPNSAIATYDFGYRDR